MIPKLYKLCRIGALPQRLLEEKTKIHTYVVANTRHSLVHVMIYLYIRKGNTRTIRPPRREYSSSTTGIIQASSRSPALVTHTERPPCSVDTSSTPGIIPASSSRAPALVTGCAAQWSEARACLPPVRTPSLLLPFLSLTFYLCFYPRLSFCHFFCLYPPSVSLFLSLYPAISTLPPPYTYFALSPCVPPPSLSPTRPLIQSRKECVVNGEVTKASDE